MGSTSVFRATNRVLKLLKTDILKDWEHLKGAKIKDIGLSNENGYGITLLLEVEASCGTLSIDGPVVISYSEGGVLGCDLQEIFSNEDIVAKLLEAIPLEKDPFDRAEFARELKECVDGSELSAQTREKAQAVLATIELSG